VRIPQSPDHVQELSLPLPALAIAVSVARLRGFFRNFPRNKKMAGRVFALKYTEKMATLSGNPHFLEII
jgi:ABC-type glycerol-3-phosphate transport system permease component